MEWDNSLIQVVIALDFGTSRSGYAYSFTDDRETVSWNMNWGQYASPYAAKTLTCLLYSPDDEPIDWGFSAYETLIKLRQEKKANDYYLIDKFKMQIPNKDGKYRYIQEDQEVVYKTPVSKKELKVFDLVVDYLRFLTQDALSKVRASALLEVPDKCIRWVLTVPAIWRDKDKQFMREAAQKVGIIDSSEEARDQLLFVLEPEAAALYCHQKGQLHFDSGTVMIVDSGEDTVDIVTYRINQDIQEIKGVHPVGGLYGLTYVDKEFRALLSKKLSTEIIYAFHNEYPLDYLKMMQTEWETLKCGIKLEDLSQEVALYFPFYRSLEAVIKRIEPDKLRQLAASQNDSEDYIECIKLTPEEIKSIFEPTLIGITSKIEEQFSLLENSSNDFEETQESTSKAPKCNAMLLVGRYSESHILQDHVKKEFSRWVGKIIVPSYPEMAVLLGAVYFAMPPSRFN